MRLFRLKKKSMDTAVQRIYDRGKKRSFVLGIGDAKFASSGKGEKAMPTTQIVKAFCKAKYRHSRKTKVKVINEFRTTMCCCACGGITQGKMKQNGHRSSRLRLCTQCNESIDKLRDRDVQATRNILWLTQYEYQGLERPWYLCRNHWLQVTWALRLFEKPPLKSLFVHPWVFQIKLYEV